MVRFHRPIVVAIAALSVFAGTPAWAEDDTDCGDEQSTADIVQCLAGEVEKLDRSIDSALRNATADATPEVAEAMKAAQTLWLKYRDANCLAYRLGEGTIAAIEAAACRVRLSRQRLVELHTGRD